MTFDTASRPLRTVHIRTPDELVGLFQSLNVVDRQEFKVLVGEIRAIEAEADNRAADRLQIAVSQFGFQAKRVPASARSGRTWHPIAGHEFLFRMPAAADANTIARALETDAAEKLEAIKMNLMALNMLTGRGHSMKEPAVRRLLKTIDEAALGFVRDLASPS